MIRRALPCLSAACACLAMTHGSAIGANFWLSTTGPELNAFSAPPANAAQIPNVPHNGVGTGTLYIWGRPDLNDTLVNFSLRVVSSDTSVVRLKSAGVEAFNRLRPAPQTTQFRWEHTSEPVGAGGGSELADLRGLRGDNSVRPSVGIGPSSTSGDQFYRAVSNSWLLASFEYEYSSVGGSAKTSSINLQIGAAGMNHQFEPSSGTLVVFGALTDAALNADSQRETNSVTPEANIVISPAAVATADFDSDGDVDGRDFLTWQRGFGRTGAAATRIAGNANGDGAINGSDLGVWRSQFGTRTPIVAGVPEPLPPAMVFSVLVSALVARGRIKKMR